MTEIHYSFVIPVLNEQETLPELIRTAYDDISIRSNPRMPLLHELEGILRAAYEGGLQPSIRR